MEEYLTTQAVAKMHGVTRGTVNNWIKNKWIKARKVGRDYLIEKTDAQQYKRRPITGRPKKEA